MNKDSKKALIGHMCGDAFGAPFEYDDNARVLAGLSVSQERYLDSVFDCGGKPARWRMPGLHTDDSQQALALLFIQSMGEADPAHWFYALMREMNARDAHRGTGRNFREAIDKMKPVDTAGMGAAMRVGPVSLAFDDWDDAEAFVQDVSEATTSNDIAIAGAVWYCRKLWEAAGRKVPSILPADEEMRLYEDAYKILMGGGEKALCDWAEPLSNKPITCAANGFAVTGIPWAVACALQYPKSFKDALRAACASGGDTDTVCALTGAMAAQKATVPPWMLRRHFARGLLVHEQTWSTDLEAVLSTAERSCREALCIMPR